MASGKTFGIQNGSRLDMNVYRGTSDQFRSLLQGTWVPFEGDYVATLDPIDFQVTHVIDGENQFDVSAKRLSNFAACVTGDIAVRIDGKKVKGANIKITGLGTWKVTMPEMQPGTYLLDFEFTDSYGFYAANALQIEYVVPEPVVEPIVP